MFNKKLAVSMMLLALFLLSQVPLFAQNNTGKLKSSRGDDFTLKIAVMGPGNELYFWWGHIALVLEDNVTGQTQYYDWGVFSFEDDNFFGNFAFGRLVYSCMVSLAENNYKVYKYYNRDITLYTLNLSAEKKEKIISFAENNILPENKDYFYHLFKDNCSTRIRDIIDMAMDGKFKEEYENVPGRYTLRQHVRRHTWFSPFFDWLLNFLMGQDIDRPITVWEEMFLPSEVADRISEFAYLAPDGEKKLLVNSVEIIHRSKDRPIVLDVPRHQWPWELLVSCIFSVILLLFDKLKRTGKSFKVSFGLIQSVLGLGFGIAGSLLFFMTFFTNHDYTYHNINVVYANPLFLALFPLGLVFAFSGNIRKHLLAERLIGSFWAYVFFAGLFAMLIKLFPAFYQQNQVDLALVLPLAMTMTYITRIKRC